MAPDESALLVPVPAELAIGGHALRQAAAEVSGHLPIATRANEVILMAGPGRHPAGRVGQWRTVATFRLGAA